MRTFLDLEVRDKVADYLTGKINLTGLRIWLAPVSMAIEQYNNPAATKLVHSLQLLFAEFTGGYWSEDELRHRLEPVASISEAVSPDAPRTQTGSGAGSTRVGLTAALP